MRTALRAGISHADFWDLTPHEVALSIEAHSEERYADMQVAAWHVCHVLNLFSKRRIRPSQLLGRPRLYASDYESPEAFAKAIARSRHAV